MYLNRYQQNTIPVVARRLHGQNFILTKHYYILGISNALVQTLNSNHFGNYSLKEKIIKNQRTHAFRNIHLLLKKTASGTVKQQVSCRPIYNKQILWQENWKYFLVIFFTPPHDATAPSIIDAFQAHSDTPHSVGFLWPSDPPIAETSTSQQSQQTNLHASGGVRNRNPSNRLAADPRHIPRGHWERHFLDHSNSYKLPAFTQPFKIQCRYTRKEEKQLRHTINLLAPEFFF